MPREGDPAGDDERDDEPDAEPVPVDEPPDAAPDDRGAVALWWEPELELHAVSNTSAATRRAAGDLMITSVPRVALRYVSPTPGRQARTGAGVRDA